MKICVITPRYSIAGVPLAQLRFAGALARAGHQVDLIIGNADPGLTLPEVPGVHISVLGRAKVRGMLGPIMHYFREKKPDVVFSAEDHLNALVYFAAILTGSRAKISGSSRVTPFDTYSTKWFSKRWFLKQFMRAVSWRADALTCVSKDMVGQYQRVFGRTRHTAVYNIVDDAVSRGKLTEAVDDPWLADRKAPVIIAAGSLVPWKGFPDLIRAIATLRDAGDTVRLLILGEGPQRGELERLIAELDLTDRVRLTGHVANPLKYYAHANVFALSSTVEGMPNVLIEAMLAGCTPVATDCETGPREILQDDRFGYLVPVGDPPAMADAIRRALVEPIPPDRLAEAVKPFEESAVIGRHLSLLDVA